MSFDAAVLASLIRALVVALAVTACSGRIAGRLRGTRSRVERGIAVVALLAVLAAPGFVVGYAWTPLVLGLDAGPRRAIVAALLACSLLPVGVGLAWLLPPPPVTRRAMHVLRLARALGARPGLRVRLGFALRGPAWSPLLRAGVVFLLAFHEFDRMAVLGEPAWTVWLFDAQVGGLPLGETLARAAVPAMIELAVLGGLAALAGGPRASVDEGTVPTVRSWHVAWVAVALALVVAVPAVLVLREASADAAAGVGFAVAGEVATALAFAAFGSGLAAILAFSLPGTRTLLLAAAPGLCGALVVGLVVQAAFQLPVLRALYDTPVPLVLALGALLLPVAVVLRIVWERTGHEPALHVAALHGARDVAWVLRDRPRVLGAMLLFALASTELVASGTLAPSGWTPAAVRLYNLMHYGHSAGLSAMVAGTVLAVVVVLAAAFVVARAVPARTFRP